MNAVQRPPVGEPGAASAAAAALERASIPATPPPPATLDLQLQALRRVALSVVRPSGPELFDTLAAELAGAMGADVVYVAVFADDERLHLRTVGARSGGQPLPAFDYPLAGSPCERVVRQDFLYVAAGMPAELRGKLPAELGAELAAELGAELRAELRAELAAGGFRAAGLDSYAAYPLSGGSDRLNGVPPGRSMQTAHCGPVLPGSPPRTPASR